MQLNRTFFKRIITGDENGLFAIFKKNGKYTSPNIMKQHTLHRKLNCIKARSYLVALWWCRVFVAAVKKQNNQFLFLLSSTNETIRSKQRKKSTMSNLYRID